MEAYDNSEGDPAKRKQVTDSLRRFLSETKAETRSVFDPLISDNRKVKAVLKACESFLDVINKLRVEYTPDEDDRSKLSAALNQVESFAARLRDKLEAEDAPDDSNGERD